jgi:aminopeptidase N
MPSPPVAARRFCLLAALALGGLVGDAQAFTADRYELALRPDFAARVLEGRARIGLRGDAEPAPALVLAAPNLQILRVAFDGVDVPFEKTADGWRVVLNDAQGRAASASLEVDYRAPAAAGLVFGDAHVHTAFHTCQWLPCAGPDLGRASLEVALELPEGFRSVASGAALPDAPDRRQRWREARPYPLYTFGFAAGRFSEALDLAGAPRLRLLGAGTDAAGLRARFKESARVLAFLEDRAGLPLPAPVYTQVLVPGAAAQEMSSFAVIGNEVIDPVQQDPEQDWVVVHEMAHQWWGNLVTCAEWPEFWLNEGIVVFMTAAWNEHRWGASAYRRELDGARRRWQRAAQAGFDKPLTWAGAYPNLRTRRDIQYGKGAVFMQTLREDLGERAFWDGLRRYTRENAWRGVRSRDLQAAMEASAGRSLQPLFERWVY